MFDFVSARRAKAQRRICPRNVEELLFRFGQTPEMRGQSGETLRQMRRVTKKIHERFGKLSIPEIEEPEFRVRVYDWRDEMANTPAECERTLRILARCISWGVDRGLVHCNRLEGLRFRWRNNTPRRAEIVWTPVQIEKIRPYLGPIAGAFELSLWSGLRQGDVLALTQKHLDHEGWLHVKPEKTAGSTGLMVHLPTERLAPLAALARGWRDRSRESLLPRVLHERTLRRHFNAAKDRAGLGDQDLHWHDLRGTLVTWLFEAGCSQTETDAVIGHAPAKGMTRSYAAQSRAYAEHAFRRLDAYMKEELGEYYARSTAAAERAVLPQAAGS
jgi:Phage integrase family